MNRRTHLISSSETKTRRDLAPDQVFRVPLRDAPFRTCHCRRTGANDRREPAQPVRNRPGPVAQRLRVNIFGKQALSSHFAPAKTRLGEPGAQGASAASARRSLGGSPRGLRSLLWRAGVPVPTSVIVRRRRRSTRSCATTLRRCTPLWRQVLTERHCRRSFGVSSKATWTVACSVWLRTPQMGVLRRAVLVAFACKGRGICPSCMGRRMSA